MKAVGAVLIVIFCAAAFGLGIGLLRQDRDKVEPASHHEEPAPEENLVLSLNIVRDAKVAAGTPILIEVAVSAGRGENGPVESVLSNPEGNWGDLVTIEVRDSSGKLVPDLSIAALERGGPSVTLGKGKSGWLAWAIEPANGKTLAAGEYTVRAMLDKTPGDDPDETKVSSAPSQLSVVATSAELPQVNALWAGLATIWILIYRSAYDQALAAAETAATADPESWLFLDAKGDILERMGRHADAVAAFDLALSKLKPIGEDAVSEPPIELIKKRDRAAKAAKAGG